MITSDFLLRKVALEFHFQDHLYSIRVAFYTCNAQFFRYFELYCNNVYFKKSSILANSAVVTSPRYFEIPSFFYLIPESSLSPGRLELIIHALHFATFYFHDR